MLMVLAAQPKGESLSSRVARGGVGAGGPQGLHDLKFCVGEPLHEITSTSSVVVYILHLKLIMVKLQNGYKKRTA